MLVFLFFSISNVISAKDRKKIFTFANRKVAFIDLPGKSLLISADCLTKTKKIKCLAYDRLMKSKPGEINQRTIDMHPGAFICREKVKGKVIVGMDKDGNQNSFCQFKDGSIVDNGSLFHYSIKR